MPFAGLLTLIESVTGEGEGTIYVTFFWGASECGPNLEY